MIVVEGCDGAGKTTLIRDLVAAYGFDVGVRGTDNRDELYKVTKPDTYRAISEALEGCHSPQVWDRLYWSDFIYAPLQDREVAFSYYDRKVIEGCFLALNAPHVLCRPPFSVVEKNSQVDHQMDGVNENLGRIWAHYNTMVGRMPNVVVYDYTNDNIQRVFDHIEKYLEQRKEREW